MRRIELRAHAKINLSLDVCGRRPDGYHEIDMILHMIGLHDCLSFQWEETPGSSGARGDDWIQLDPGAPFLPTGGDNLIVQAARAMEEKASRTGKFKEGVSGGLFIQVEKNIPVAAGLAGGSADGAATLLALDHLWELKLPLEELCRIGAKLGADVPFALMGTAAMNPTLGRGEDPSAAVCARARGVGEEVTPLPPLDGFVALSKPPIGVSTGKAYQGVDEVEIQNHPDVSAQSEAIRQGRREEARRQMINVLEHYTLSQYPSVGEIKEKMKEICPDAAVLMSGSGPTVFALTNTASDRDRIVDVLKGIHEETYATELAAGYQPN